VKHVASVHLIDYNGAGASAWKPWRNVNDDNIQLLEEDIPEEDK
jgi:hypothetical protein